MKRPRALVASCGCKLNQAEADLWKSHLVNKGYDVVEDAGDNANGVKLCLVTTCTVTEPADRSSVALIRRLRRKYPAAEIKVTGCGTEVITDRLSGLDGVTELIRFSKKEDTIGDLPFSADSLVENITRSRAFLRTGDGCNRRCTYCIVSRIRGNPRSKPAGMIIDELHTLADAGFCEVVLVALNLGLWGIERGESLAGLIRRIDESGLKTRIRLTSLEPDTVTAELLEAIASSERICPHLHVPLQSGDDAVLSKMNRPYAIRDYAELLECITRCMPEVCIGTDIITATPGEDEESFRKTLEFARSLPLAYLHAFTFSPRPGTPMTKMKQSIRNPRERTALLRRLGKEKSLVYRKRFTGKTREAVVLSPTRVLTDNYIDVAIGETTAPRRSIVNVRITDIATEKSFGEVVAYADAEECS